MSFWRKANGKLICDENGKLINCDHCPCEGQSFPCNEWLTEVSGQPVLYNISLSLNAHHYVKWHNVYGEEEEEYYEGEESLTMTATMSNVPASAVINGGLSFQVSSVDGSDFTRYEYHGSEGYVEIQETTKSLSSIIGGGCPTQDPENEIPDDNMHGWTFVCNENQGQFYIRVSASVGSCHGTIEEYYESPYGQETNTYESPVDIGVVTQHLVFPAVSARARYIEEHQGYVLISNAINLSYKNGEESDDEYQNESYSLSITFSPIIPGGNNP